MSTEDTDQAEDEDEDIQYFVRIGQTDLDGTKSIENSLSDMNGIGRRTARIIARQADVDRRKTIGRLDDDVIDDIVESVESYGESVGDHLCNRQNDFFTGETTHEMGNDLSMSQQHDVNRMQMIRSYRGIRHERNQKVRGQRTKSTGRTEGTIGVNIEAIKAEQAEDAEDEE